MIRDVDESFEHECLSVSDQAKTSDLKQLKENYVIINREARKKEKDRDAQYAHLDIPELNPETGKNVTSQDQVDASNNAAIAPRIGFSKGSGNAPVQANCYSAASIETFRKFDAELRNNLIISVCKRYYGDELGEEISEVMKTVIQENCEKKESIESMNDFADVVEERGQLTSENTERMQNKFRFVMCEIVAEILSILAQQIQQWQKEGPKDTYVCSLFDPLPHASDLRKKQIHSNQLLQQLVRYKSLSIAVDIVWMLIDDEKLQRKCTVYKKFVEEIQKHRKDGSNYSNFSRDFNEAQTTFAFSRQFFELRDIFPVK